MIHAILNLVPDRLTGRLYLLAELVHQTGSKQRIVGVDCIPPKIPVIHALGEAAEHILVTTTVLVWIVVNI